MDTKGKWMKRVLELAALGRGLTTPNPLVGAILVRDGEILGEAWHQKAGDKHAERLLLEKMDGSFGDTTLVVNLEPCCHWGRTPPCTDIIIEKGIRHVIIGDEDPDSRVSGEGIRVLRKAGVRVEIGVLKEECRMLNRIYYHYKETGTPLVTMKYAMTVDGKIATAKGESRWITGPAAREQVHRSRHEHSGIMVGIGTVVTDDPMLDCRIPGGRSGVRIICDSKLRISADSRLVQSAHEIPLILATAGCPPELEKKKRELEELGCLILEFPGNNGRVDLNGLMSFLASKEIDSILLEGGGALNEAALQSGIVNRVQVYVAPKVFGGESARSPVGGLGAESIEEAFQLRQERLEVIGEDIFIEYDVVGREKGCLPESLRK